MSGTVDPEIARMLEEAGQGHLLEHAATLPPAEGEAFLASVAAEPWAQVRAALAEAQTGPTPSLRPPQALTLGRQDSEGGLRATLARTGEGLITGGRVATLLLAGGQGTRLGLQGPKGDFVLGPDDDRTLYAIHGERIAAASRRIGRPIPYLVILSEATEAATREAFDAHGASWGLQAGQVRFATQRQFPALDDQGRAVIEAPGRLSMAPDGHGGAFRALREAGLLDELASNGVDVLTTFQVDNPLARPLDPVMLGWMVERRAQATGKAVRRRADEKVGVYARTIQGRHLIVEYSEFPDGGMPEDLVMGSIALHGFSVAWLKSLFDGGLELPFHRARKKVPYLGADGQTVTPGEPNAWKFEQFIFDVFPHAERATVHEVDRAHEFAPVKNAQGVDSPETARALVTAEVRRLYESQGREPPTDLALRPLDL